MTRRLRTTSKPKRVPRANPERELQKSVFALIGFNRVPRLIAYHAFNEGKRAVRSAGFYRSIGMLPGVADVCLILPDGRAAFLELKAPGERSSQDQRRFARECEANGAPYAVADNIEEASAILFQWGALRSNPLSRHTVRAAA